MRPSRARVGALQAQKKRRKEKTWISANASRLWVRESNVIIFLWLIAVPHSLSALPSHSRLLDTKPVQSPRLTSSRGEGNDTSSSNIAQTFFHTCGHTFSANSHETGRPARQHHVGTHLNTSGALIEHKSVKMYFPFWQRDSAERWSCYGFRIQAQQFLIFAHKKSCWTRLGMAANHPTMFFSVRWLSVPLLCWRYASRLHRHLVHTYFSGQTLRFCNLRSIFSLLCSSTLNSPGEQFWRLEKHKTILFECLIDVNAFVGLCRGLRFSA